MEDRVESMVAQLGDAVADFRISLSIDMSALEPVVADVVKSGQAQQFEFSIELCWKTLKLVIDRIHGFDIQSPKQVVKKWFELGYIDYNECEQFLRGLDIRNSLSHVYKRSAFLLLHAEILSFRPVFEVLLDSINTEPGPR